MLKHLSPTSLTLFLDSPEDFYLRYLTKYRPEREPQTKPMSVGSAFDSYVKAHLRAKLFGDNEAEVFTEYFESSVDIVNRDEARKTGKDVFNAYCRSGALSDLLLAMQSASEGPKFEFFIRDEGQSISDEPGPCKCGLPFEKHDQDGRAPDCNMYDSIGNVRFLGKPDAWFVTASGARIILDWKVNGYYSQASPKPGYVRIRSGLGATRGDGGTHKNVIFSNVNGVLIDGATNMEAKDSSWARQLSIYAWLCGEAVGGDIVGFIDQIVCAPGKIRVAEHRCLVGKEFQIRLYEQAREAWEICNSNWIFRNMSLSDSQSRCKELDNIAKVQNDPAVRAMYGK